MKVPTSPPLIRLDPNVGELKDEEQCRQGECYDEDERQREIATHEAAAFGFEDAEAREDSHAIHRPSRRSNCFTIGSDDHGEMPRRPGRLHGLLVPILANRRHEESRVARKSCPATKSSSSHPRLDDYGKETGRG